MSILGTTVVLQAWVEGTPAPTFKWYKGMSELFESNRHKFTTDGASNSVMLTILKAKPDDEETYKIVVTNEHGSDETQTRLFVTPPGEIFFNNLNI